MAVDVGTGTTVTFGTSGFSANVTNIDWSDINREAIQTSHLGTVDAHTHIPGKLYDSGSIELEIQFDPEDGLPPINGAAETITITFPDESVWSGTGFATGFTATVPLEELMTGTLTLKISGVIDAGDGGS